MKTIKFAKRTTNADIEAAAAEAYGGEATVFTYTPKWSEDAWHVLSVHYPGDDQPSIIGRRRSREELMALAERGPIVLPT